MKATIIGASTPGLFAAYLLAREGVEVEVYEKGMQLGWPPRTLIVTSKLDEMLGFSSDEAVINRVKHIELFSTSRSASLELAQPDLIIERAKLIGLLADKAQRAGARLRLKRSFVTFAQVGDKVLVVLKNVETREEQRTSTDVLIGADGAFSVVSRVAARDGHRLSALLQASVPLPADLSSDTVQVWFDTTRTSYFYWLIPESEKTAAVGLVADSARQAGNSLTAFLQERQLQPVGFQAAVVPLHRFEPMLISNSAQIGRNVFLIGDAAGHVKVTTVGGVITGLRAARALTGLILNREDSREHLRRLKLELDLHLLLRRMLSRFTNQDYDSLVELLDGKLKHLLSIRTRDELASTFMRLILSEPRLMLLGAKALLRST